MKTIEEEIQTNVAGEIYTYIAIPINSLKQSNDIIQTVQPLQIASNVIYNVLPHDGTTEKIQTYTLTDQFIETLRENDKEPDVIENQESLRPTVIEQINNTRKSVILETSLNKDEALTYECLSCGEVFKSRPGYRKHLEKHKEKLYKCDECSASYNCEINFKLHKVVHTKDATVCPVCEKSFNRMASLKNHLTFHEIEETFTCTECWAAFDAEEEYNKHIQNHKSEAQSLQILLVCSVCDEKFEDRAMYKQHILFHTEVKKLLKIRKTPKKRKAVKRTSSHLCDVCKKTFSKYCLLIRHKRIHTGEKPYVCHYCDRAFAQKGTLRIHLKIHTGLKPFKCTICMAKFSQKCNLRAHVQRTHLHEKTSEKIYGCQLCACAFKRIASLNAHTTRFHRGDKDSNDIVDLMQQIDQLENQMNNKTNLPINDILKRNVIENDSEKFVRLADSSVEGPIQYFLVKQKKTTEGLWYACSYCEKEFKKPSDLIRHIRIHTMQKPFKCKHCNRRFSLKSTLKNHVVSHANFRSYECIICKATFNSKKSLKNNSKIDDKFICGSCKPAASDFKVKRVVNVEKLEALKVLNNLNIDIELKQPMVESSEGLVPIISPKAKIHSDSANSNRPKLHRCHCGAEFFQLKKLQNHMLIHTSEKKFKCYVCTKGFHNSQALKEHIKSVHNGERKFLCRICDKRFVTNTILKRHMITHSFVKPYICPYCKKRFKTILHCRQHIKLHKKDILLNALTANESNKFTNSFVAEAALPENLFANTLPDGSYNLGLNFDNLTDSAGISGASNLLSETSESVEQNKGETQILYTDKGNGVIVSTPLDISQTHDGKIKLEQQLLLTSTALPSYDESTKNISTDNLENVDDTIATLPQENSTVFLNFDDLHLATSNLYSSYPNLKNFDQLLGEISEIQDNNILLTSDSSLSQLTDSQLDTSNFDGLMPFAFNTNISLNNVTLSTTNPFPNGILSNVSEDVPDLNQVPLPDLPYDVKKSSGVEESQKMLEEKEEKPILSNLLETSSSGEPIISNTDETIFENVDFTCSSCKKYLDNVEDLVHHYCAGKVAAEGITKESQNDGLPSYEDSIQAKKKIKNGHKCKKCNKTFTTKLSLQKHVVVLHREKKNAASNICSYCEKGFKKHSDLLRHVRTHTGEKPFTCDMCQKNFTLKSTLETHRRTHNPESHQKYDCGVCGTHVSSKASLRVHMMMHTGAKPYQCSVCFENFRTSGHRRSHMRTHLNNNKARKQSKSTKVTTMLQSVITETQNSEELYEEVLLLNNSQHLEENKELILQDSEVLFPNQTVQVDSLILQQLQQSCVLLEDGNDRIPPFIQVDFNNYGEITNVKSIRDIQESFKTTEPDKNTENIYLTKKASPERNFECDICHKKYTTKSVLTKHKRIHNKLNCAKCNIKFMQSEELQEHLKIHNVIRPFACSLCDNSFSLKKNLITHMKRIHSASFP